MSIMAMIDVLAKYQNQTSLLLLFIFSVTTVNLLCFYLKLEQQSMVHHRKYPRFYLLPLPLGQGHTNCSSVPST